jgi:hypothetical protein
MYVGKRLHLDPDPDPKLITDPDPNMQIISDPAGSGSTTLCRSKKKRRRTSVERRTPNGIKRRIEKTLTGTKDRTKKNFSGDKTSKMKKRRLSRRM